MPGGKRGGRNEVYFAELDPMMVSPDDELPGFRNGSEVLVLVNGYTAASRHEFTRSSTGAYLTDETVGSSLIQAIVDIRTKQALYWNDWRSMSKELSMAIWNAKPQDMGAGGAKVPPVLKPVLSQYLSHSLNRLRRTEPSNLRRLRCLRRRRRRRRTRCHPRQRSRRLQRIRRLQGCRLHPNGWYRSTKDRTKTMRWIGEATPTTRPRRK